MRKFYIPGAGIVATLLLAVLAWAFLASAEPTIAQEACSEVDPVDSYDIRVSSTIKDLGESKFTVRIQGKKTHTTWEGHGSPGFERIYDGESTVYTRHFPSTKYETDKIEWSEGAKYYDADFPYGRDYICPNINELGAEYVETDSKGKKYEIAPDDKRSYTFWVDDAGWLLEVESESVLNPGMVVYTTISGIGEHNEIEIPSQ